MTFPIHKIRIAATLAIITAICAVPGKADDGYIPRKGEKTVSVAAGYVSRYKSISAGVAFSYRFSKVFTLAPSVDYIFRHHDYDGLMINLDTRYSLPLTTPRWDVYPIAGANITSWTHHHPKLDDNDDDVTSRTNRLGLNAGLGVAFRVTPTMRLALEGKGEFVKSMSTAVVKLSIGYTF